MSVRGFQPYKLMAALEKIRESHSLKQRVRPAFSEEQLQELLERIEQAPAKELPILASELSRREIQALAEYFPGNKWSKNANKLVVVLACRMNQALYQNLWEGWQNFPENGAALRLLAMPEPSWRPPQFPLDGPTLLEWTKHVLEDGRVSESLYREINRDFISHGTGVPASTFESAFQKSPLRTETALYHRCRNVYLATASISTLEVEGDSVIVDAIRHSMGTPYGEAIMRNVLHQPMDRLKRFRIPQSIRISPDRYYANLAGTFSQLESHYGTPLESRFGADKAAYEAYLYWYNVNYIRKGFGKDADTRRAEFWLRYVASLKAVPGRLRKKQFVIMDFGQYVAVESEVMGTLYIFPSDIYEGKIRGLIEVESETYAKSHMKRIYESDPRNIFKQIHTPNKWQGAVRFALMERNIRPTEF